MRGNVKRGHMRVTGRVLSSGAAREKVMFAAAKGAWGSLCEWANQPVPYRPRTQLDRIEARLIILTERFSKMADDFTALTQSVNDLGTAVTATSARVQADFDALKAAQASNDQPTIDALTASIQDSLTHLNAIGSAATSATPDAPVEVPTPPASIADPSDPTTVAPSAPVDTGTLTE